MRNKIISILLIMILLVSGCSKVNNKETSKEEVNETVEDKEKTIESYTYKNSEEITNYVEIVTNKDKVILVELYPDMAPITVENFQNLVKDKFYDGLLFHRVIADFMIQTGDPTATGFGGSNKTIKGEFKANGVKNSLKHDQGIVSMARANGDMDSASSQFFICVNTNDKLSYLDGNYAAFGQVIAGYNTVLEISKVSTDMYDKPVDDQGIKTIRFIELI